MSDPTNLHGPDDPAMEEALRGALHREAAQVRPEDRFDQIETGAVQSVRNGRMFGLIAVAAGLVAILGISVGVMINRAGEVASTAQPADQGQPSLSPPVPSVSVPPSSNTPTEKETPAGKKLEGIPVYWIAGSDEYKLYREFQTVPDKGGPATSAVSALLTGEPLDPDYETAFSPEGKVKVTKKGDNLTVDLDKASFGESILDQNQAQAAIQSIVWTATAAAKTSGTVTITIDGKPGKAWDQVSVGKPMKRDMDARNDIWIIKPYEGQPLTVGKVTVSGESRSFEANLVWTVTDEQGAVIADGVTTGGANADFGAFSFSTDLKKKGTYEIAVVSEDASGAGQDITDTKTVTVK
ncbi:MAG: GerMN domain-containing protein [Propionibacteriales bacterium]|nr:GerMN domain-containing protein [Propionibacteriales bacterium]